MNLVGPLPVKNTICTVISTLILSAVASAQIVNESIPGPKRVPDNGSSLLLLGVVVAGLLMVVRHFKK